MNLLNLKKLATALTVACSLAFASSASAALLELTSSNYLGSIDPGSPASGSAEEAYIDKLISMAVSTSFVDTVPNPDKTYTRSSNVLAGLIAADFEAKSNTGAVTEFTLTGTTSYVLAKFGNTSHAWFVLGYVGDIEVLSTTGKGGGLSHVSFFGGSPTNVPDSGATIAFIALGLTGLALVARRRKA